jgi:hypothetical protein
MNEMKKIVVLFLFYSEFLQAQTNKALPDYLQLQPAVHALSVVMMHDVTSPPVAARYYAYGMLGAYTIVSQNNASIPSLSKFVKSYQDVSIPEESKKYDYRVAAVFCILETGRQMLPSGYMLEDVEARYIQRLKKNKLSSSIINESVAVAKQVAKNVVSYSKADHYNQLSTLVNYTPLKGDGYWYPTPPSYMEAVEPHWNTIRVMLIDSASEFKPYLPTPFSKDSGSSFYNLAREVYDVSKNPSREQLDVAGFWDCNPFTVTTSGHMMIGFKKITPGGHWMNIASIACANAQLNFDQSVQVHTITALTLMDAFISSWDEKYRSNRIRPETYINRYIDVKWQPLLQTPPFPEYTSAHSVISTAAAVVLSYLLGDNFSFTDNSEEMFQLAPRSYQSFMQAANEAAISRLYGGIHFRDSIENGQAEGKSLGEKIVAILAAAGIQKIQ